MKHWAKRVLLLLVVLLCLNGRADARGNGAVHSLSHDGWAIKQGIDVSEHNGRIDWNRVAQSDIEFAFIRAGYRGYSSGGLYEDAYFPYNLENALAAGMHVGVYFYSQATTPQEAADEANYLLRLVGEHAARLTLPFVIDFEYAESNGYTGRLYNARLSAEAATAVVNAFCDTIYRAGYDACVYANSVMLSEKLNAEQIIGKVWLAHYTVESAYEGDYTFWQYDAAGQVSGLSGYTDMNYWYVSAPDPWEYATGIEINRASLTIFAGETVRLTAEKLPSTAVDTIRWRSSDPTIAYVDKFTGDVTGFRMGEVEIEAYTSQGVTASCRVLVDGVRPETVDLHLVRVADAIYTGGSTKTELVICSGSLAGATGVVKNDGLNLRAWPSTELAPLAVLEQGSALRIYDKTFQNGLEWYAVSCSVDGAIYRGFVAGDYVTLLEYGQELIAGRDYTVAYQDNDAPGTATVTVTAVPGSGYSGSVSKPFRILSFTDLKPTDWYFDVVLSTVRAGRMNGVADERFAPNDPTTRAMLAMILYRMAGEPSGSFDVVLDDVPRTEWFCNAVLWAAANGIDSGSNGEFAPNRALTRTEMVKMLYHYALTLGEEPYSDWSVCESYSDWNTVPDHARDAFSWAIANGIINGLGNNQLMPNDGATRAQICAVLTRFDAVPISSAPDFEFAGD